MSSRHCALHTDRREKSAAPSVEEGHDVERQQVRRALAHFWARERIPPESAKKPAAYPRDSSRQRGDGPQPSSVEEPRLQGRGIRERPDAGDNDTSLPPRSPHLPPVPAEKPWPMLKSVPPKIQPGANSISTLGRGPVGPPGTGSTEEALSAPPLVLTRHEPAKNLRFSQRLTADAGDVVTSKTKPRTARQLEETPEARAGWDRISRMLDASGRRIAGKNQR